MRGETWPAEKIELLRRLWSDGATAATIGARLGGRSRSAVLGKIFRLRLGAGRAAVAGKTESSSPAARDRLQTGQIEAPPRRRRQRIKPVSLPAKTPTQHKTLFELTNQTCRWPHGRPGTQNFFFCGAPEADLEQGRPYCARHMQRAYHAHAGDGEREKPTDRRELPPAKHVARGVFAALLRNPRGNAAPHRP